MSTDRNSTEPIAYAYELAHAIDSEGNYTDWRKRVTFFKPSVPDNSIRNLVALVPMQDALKLRRARSLINYQGRRIKLLEARIDAQNERATELDCSIGVGAGFVHGPYEAVKAVQRFIFRAERETRLEQMLAKIYPHFDSHVSKELSDGGCGPEMTALLELRQAIEEEFSRGPDGKPEQVRLVISRLYSTAGGIFSGAQITIVTTSGREYPVSGKLGSPMAESAYVKYVDAPIKGVVIHTRHARVTIDGRDW